MNLHIKTQKSLDIIHKSHIIPHIPHIFLLYSHKTHDIIPLIRIEPAINCTKKHTMLFGAQITSPITQGGNIWINPRLKAENYPHLSDAH